MDARSGAVQASAFDLFADRHFRWLIIWPAIVVLLLVGLFPVIYSLIVSFQKITRRVTDTSFHGFYNYERLLGDERFWDSVLTTATITAIALPLQLVLGLLLARLFLDRFPGRQVLIAVLLLPAVIAPFVSGAMWRLMFDNIFGSVNEILRFLAGGSFDLIWHVNSNPVIVFSAILIAEVWQWTPFMFLILLAAWTNVDRSQIESAEIDGASGWRIFRYIVLPAIRPVIIVALTIRGLDLVRLFDVVWGLTRGGPGNMTETITIYAYIKGFEMFNISLTAAFTFTVIIALSLLMMVLLKKVAITA